MTTTTPDQPTTPTSTTATVTRDPEDPTHVLTTRVHCTGRVWRVMFEHPNGLGVRVITRDGEPFKTALDIATNPMVRAEILWQLSNHTCCSTPVTGRVARCEPYRHPVRTAALPVADAETVARGAA